MRPVKTLFLGGLLVGAAFTSLGCSSGGGGGGGGGTTTPANNPPANNPPANNPPANNPPANNPPVTPGALGQIFPANNAWNQDISTLPVHANSANYVASIGANTGLHPDFGTVYNGAPNGIPFITVGAGEPLVTTNFVAYDDESDPGPYPIPVTAPIEGGPSSNGDRHVIAVDTANRKLYELYRAFPNGSGGWDADCGAVFDLNSNALRPAGWTSADAAGLPIFPGLVRYDEAVTAGAINHALRFTVSVSQRGYIEPARHFASSNTDPNRPPMGLRLRLKASFDVSSFPPEVRVILNALKRYGMIVADNGSNWYISGAPDSRWSDSNLATLSQVKGSDFEAVETGPIITQ
jgi:hypothetical protein